MNEKYEKYENSDTRFYDFFDSLCYGGRLVDGRLYTEALSNQYLPLFLATITIKLV